jgi:branched-chain amino acid transport system substrate-binding protein
LDSGTIRIGLLYSTSGPYRTIGRAMLNGALLALEQVNADPALPFTLEPVVRDPGGRNERYAELARWMLADQHLVHVVGCYTSSSRKEVLPFFEKYDGLLWYPSHYEGFESSEHVIYTGAAPNQHIVPLADYMLCKFGRSAYLVGSNYIWAWENNKIMREAAHDAGGEVVVERYLPVGETDVSAIVGQVLDCRPSFVFNTLIEDRRTHDRSTPPLIGQQPCGQYTEPLSPAHPRPDEVTAARVRISVGVAAAARRRRGCRRGRRRRTRRRCRRARAGRPRDTE